MRKGIRFKANLHVLIPLPKRGLSFCEINHAERSAAAKARAASKPKPRRSHLTKETQEVVRLGIGMISVLSSLVLGLLIATAKNSYDTTATAVRTYAAELALLNETLRDYGGDAAKPRDFLREYTEWLRDDIWPPDGAARRT